MENHTTSKLLEIQLKNGEAIVVSSKIGTGIKSFLDRLEHEVKRTVITPDLIAKKAIGFSEIKNSIDKPLRLDGAVTDLLFKSFLSARMEQGISTIIVDPYCTSESRRAQYTEISEKFGKKLSFVSLGDDVISPEHLTSDASVFGMMDNEARMLNAEHTPLPLHHNNHPNFNGSISLVTNHIADPRLDIVGDIHGMFGELKMLLENMGYQISGDRISHPEGRKLVFLGDYLDRGYDSVNTLRLVKNAVESGHYAIRGNHEEMLLQSLDEESTSGKVYVKSIASAGSVDQLLRLPTQEKRALLDFIKSLPLYLTHQDYAFVHADIETFNPHTSPKSSLVFGDSYFGTKPADAIYSKNHLEGINKFKLIRGHSKSFSSDGLVISLDGGQAFAGDLIGLRLDRFTQELENNKPFADALSASSYSVKCDYNFSNILKDRMARAKEIRSLIDQKLVKVIDSIDSKFVLINFTDEVYAKKTWGANSFLDHCRGMVFSLDGQVVIAGQEVINEIGTTAKVLSKNERVFYFETVSGFNINLGRNPYQDGVIISSASSLHSRYTEMAKALLDKQGVLSRVDSLFLDRKVTLNLTVQHHLDPRGVTPKNGEADMAFLISGKNNETFEALSEEELNNIARLIGVRRPEITFGKFASVRDTLFTSPQYSVTVRLAGDSQNIYYKIPTLSGITRKINRMVKGQREWSDIINTSGYLFENDVLRQTISALSKEMTLKEFRFNRDNDDVSRKISSTVRAEYIALLKDGDLNKTNRCFDMG